MDPQEIRVELVRITMQLEEIREQETWQKVSSNNPDLREVMSCAVFESQRLQYFWFINMPKSEKSAIT